MCYCWLLVVFCWYCGLVGLLRIVLVIVCGSVVVVGCRLIGWCFWWSRCNCVVCVVVWLVFVVGLVVCF